MTPRIAHVFPRSPFLSFTADVFDEAVPGANHFFVLGQPAPGEAAGLPEGPEYRWITPDAAGAEVIAGEVAASDIAIFHSVGAYAARILAGAPQSVVSVWSGWGGDYYGRNTAPNAGLLAPLTRRAVTHRVEWPYATLAALRLLRANRPVAAAARAADVFSAPIPDDLAVFRRRFPRFRGRYAQLNYASLEDSFTLSASAVDGDDILVGNSAAPTNNHLDVLTTLKRFHTAGRRVITPLSYGPQAYADVVVAEGTRLFGEDFVPLREFMPLNDYQDVIAGCGVVVMGQRRQQAIGNVAAALWGGAHVLMDSRSPLYRFLAARGATVTALSDVTELPARRVSDAERTANIELLEEFWGRKTVVANIRALVGSVTAR